MQKKIVWEWETIDEDVERVKVNGGWLLRYWHGKGEQDLKLIFIEDRDWQWCPIEPYRDVQQIKSDIAKDF
jgi:hypothetical protein